MKWQAGWNSGWVCVFLATSVNIKHIRLKPPSRVASLSQVYVCVLLCVYVHGESEVFYLLFTFLCFCLPTDLFIYFFCWSGVYSHTHSQARVCTHTHIDPSMYWCMSECQFFISHLAAVFFNYIFLKKRNNLLQRFLTLSIRMFEFLFSSPNRTQKLKVT